MHFRQLEDFRETLRAGSVTKAAKNMNISQPSISRFITDLEINAGFALFHRMGVDCLLLQRHIAFIRLWKVYFWVQIIAMSSLSPLELLLEARSQSGLYPHCPR